MAGKSVRFASILPVCLNQLLGIKPHLERSWQSRAFSRGTIEAGVTLVCVSEFSAMAMTVSRVIVESATSCPREKLLHFRSAHG
jgi:hypothetical protein